MPENKEYEPKVGNKIQDSVSSIKIVAKTDDGWLMVRRPSRAPFVISQTQWIAAYHHEKLSEAKLLKDGEIDIPKTDEDDM